MVTMGVRATDVHPERPRTSFSYLRARHVSDGPNNAVVEETKDKRDVARRRYAVRKYFRCWLLRNGIS